MRKYLLGIVAIVLAVGFSSYTKPVHKKNKFTTYYFQASNSVSGCSSVSLTFPTSMPPTSVSSCSGSNNICYMGFPTYIVQNNFPNPDTYLPSVTGTTQAANCDATETTLKP